MPHLAIRLGRGSGPVLTHAPATGCDSEPTGALDLPPVNSFGASDEGRGSVDLPCLTPTEIALLRCSETIAGPRMKRAWPSRRLPPDLYPDRLDDADAVRVAPQPREQRRRDLLTLPD